MPPRKGEYSIMVKDHFLLSNGERIPSIGFGTWKLPVGAVAESAVRTAIECGYRLIDAAAIYGNEKSVGTGIRSSGIDRKDVFLSSKLWNTEHGYQSTLNAFEKTINDLQVDYLDLYLIHWPNPVQFRDCYVEKNVETWKAFEKLHAEGKIKSIGVSNFFPRHIDEMLPSIDIKPMVNQIEFRPSCMHMDIVDYCRSNNILIQGYSPLAGGRIFKLEELKAIAQSCGRPLAQVILRWSLQHGVLPLPKSEFPTEIKENFAVYDFELTDIDMRLIDAVTTCEGLGESDRPDDLEF